MLDMNALRGFGIDTEEGMVYCAEDPEFYEEMIGEFASEGQEKIAELQRFYDASDWKNYGIRTHAVKSTARMIGAKGLSEKARALEAASKASEEVIVRDLHAEFINAYRTLLEQLEKALN